jgi:hypothetical protein
LNATFAPWIEKVEIVNNIVSDKNDDYHLSLDSFVENHAIEFNFLKIDVDGSERVLLEGAKGILSSGHKFKLVICTYHNREDESLMRAILEKNAFSIQPSSGYMIFYYDSNQKPPFLRRGLLRATGNRGSYLLSILNSQNVESH